ncbi:MAG: HEAT repeat domain-containing protein [Planctomycetota bacterium]|jgi:hypothetical protein
MVLPLLGVLLLGFTVFGSARGGEAALPIEAEDRRFIRLQGSWARLAAEEAREGGVAGVASGTAGASLRLDFTGILAAARVLHGPWTRRVRIQDRPRLFDWRTFPGPRITCSVDGGAPRMIDLTAGSGWGDVLLGQAVPDGRHTLTVTIVEGNLFIDRFVVHRTPPPVLTVLVKDETGRPVTDALVEFRRRGVPVAVLRTQRDGSTGAATHIPPGDYSVAVTPDDDDGTPDGRGIADDPRLPEIRHGVSIRAGKTSRLEFTLYYRQPSDRPPSRLLRPALGYPVIRRPGGVFPLVFRPGANVPRRVSLKGRGGRLVDLRVGDAREGPYGEHRVARIPPSLPPGPYRVVLTGEGWTEEHPPTVFLRSSMPSSYVLAHMSDTHVRNLRGNWGASNALAGLAAEVNKHEPVFAFLTGDLTHNGLPSEFLRFRRALASFTIPVFVCEGNHDHFDGHHRRNYRGRDAYQRFMGLRSYPVRFGEDRFAVLGTGVYEPLAPEAGRSASRFLGASKGGLKALVFHYDYTGALPSRGAPVLGNQIAHLAAETGARLLLEGHLHRARSRRVASGVAYMAPAARNGGYALVHIQQGEAVRVSRHFIPPPGREPPALEAYGPGGAPEGSPVEGVRALYRKPMGREALVRLLREAPDGKVRAAAAALLARGGWVKPSREALVAALADPDPFVRVEAVRAMAADTVVSPLKKALVHSDSRVRVAAVKALGRVRGPAAVRALAEALGDGDPDVACRAAAVLGGFHTRSIARVLGTALREAGGPFRVRRTLIRSIESVEGREAVPDLLAVLADPDLALRAEAAVVLGRWKVRAAIPELIRLVEEGLDAQQSEAHRLLVRMTGVDHSFGTPEAREKWEAWWEAQGRR